MSFGVLQVPADSLQAVLDRVFAAPAYDWVERPDPLGWLREWWFALIDWISELQAANPVLYRLLLWGLVALLAAILLHALWVFVQTLRHATAEEHAAAPGARVDRRDARWYARASDTLAREGRYADALGAAFLALALHLDERGLIRYHPSKTPQEYTRDRRLAGEDRARLAELVRSLYRYTFGGQPCGADEYRRWRELAAGEWHAAAG